MNSVIQVIPAKTMNKNLNEIFFKEFGWFLPIMFSDTKVAQ